MPTVRSWSEAVLSYSSISSGKRRRTWVRSLRSSATPSGARSTATPPGHDPIHHQAVPEAGVGGAQHQLAQHAAMGVHQRKRGVVADRADVAEMIGDALELGHERAQPDRARRRLDPRCGFHRPGEGERIGDRAVARGAAGESRGAREIGSGHQPLDALVDVAEALLQAHHGLAVRGEAEVPRLDDAGVHRPDRDLVQALALDRQEPVGVGCGRLARLRAERALDTPDAVVEPGPLVEGAVCLQAEQIVNRPLEPDRRRMTAR